MNKQIKVILLAMALPVVMLVSSCRKDTLNQTETSGEVSKATTEARSKQKDIVAWIDKHRDSGSSAKLRKLDDLKANLLLNELTVESRDNGDNLIIIPLKDDVKSALLIKANSQLNLIIVQSKDGKYRYSNIVAYNSADGNSVSNLRTGTIQNLVNNKSISYNGIFQFYSITGKLIFQQKYKDGILVSYGRVVNANELNNSKKQQLGVRCREWYLFEIIFWSDGSMTYSETYLYTTCENEDTTPDEGGGGSGGSGPGGESPEPPELPNDMYIHKTYTYTVSENDLTNYDLYIPSSSEPEYDPDGNIIPQSPTPLSVTKKYVVEVDFRKTTGEIVTVALVPIQVTPSYDVYMNPTFGQTTRNVSPNTSYKNFTVNNHVIHCEWQGSLQFLWTFTNTGQTQLATKNADFTTDIHTP